MEFRALTRANIDEVRKWRNKCLVALRTPFLLTKDMQEKFYDDVINNRNSRARFWAVVEKKDKKHNLVAMTGLENIEWENGLAEISIMIDPNRHGEGLGKKIIHELLRIGFNDMRLDNIYGECYECNPAIGFWESVCNDYNGFISYLPNRKYWNGKHYGSMYFNINKEDFIKCLK